jgi:bacteriocin-like protein
MLKAAKPEKEHVQLRPVSEEELKQVIGGGTNQGDLFGDGNLREGPLDFSKG